jgi:hypothetical protein
MLILGLLLLAATGAFAGLAIADNPGGGPDYAVTVLGHDVGTVNTLGAFVAGAAVTLAFLLGCVMASSGARRARRRSAELRAARAAGLTARPARAAAGRAAAPAGADPVKPSLARRLVHRLGH